MIAETRDTVALALATLGIPVHAYPPESIAPPAAVLIPDSPYIEGHRVDGRIVVRLQLQLLTLPKSARNMDALIEDSFALLLAARVLVDEVAAPTVDPDTGVLSCRISLMVQAKKE